MNFKGYKIIEFTVLLLGATLFFVLFWVFRHDRITMIKLAGVAAVFYSMWGIFHHLVEDRLSLDIVLEYILISIFVFMLVFTALSV